MGLSTRTFCILLTVLAVSPRPLTVRADCECGYTVNATAFPFTDLLETDFLHLKNLTLNSAWLPQSYSVNASTAHGPYGKTASLDNVIPNPIPGKHDDTGRGISGGDPGLQLWVRGGIPKDGLIPMGEIATSREDMLYGSFRASLLVSDVPGTCAAFFWYFNDTEEIDIEFLSTQLNASASSPVNLVLHSPASQHAGHSAAGTPTFDVHPLPFRPDGAYHEYRFDWTPGRVSFYADGAWLKDMTASVPSSPGHLILSHWSDGNAAWSAGPPGRDAVLTVSYVKAYFNSSASERKREYARRCVDARAENATCVVPDQMGRVGPGGSGPGGSFFFSEHWNMTVGQPDPSATVVSEALARGGMRGLRVLVLVLVGVVVAGVL